VIILQNAKMSRPVPTLEEMKAQIRAAREPDKTCRAGATVFVARHGEPFVSRAHSSP